MKKSLKIIILTVILSTFACTEEWQAKKPEPDAEKPGPAEPQTTAPKQSTSEQSQSHLSGNLSPSVTISGSATHPNVHFSGSAAGQHVSGR